MDSFLRKDTKKKVMDNVTAGAQIVYSAGNSWIICRSKSYGGRIYYFNTLTGEAAWNLSAVEIEKAKSRMNCLVKGDMNINLNECPEPKDPPMDQPMQQIPQKSPTTYNKQIINNQFTNQPFSMPPMIIPPFGPLANPMVTNPMVTNRMVTDPMVTNPMNTILPVAMNSQTPAYNTNVWAVPPTHQIFIAPSMSSLVNQAQSASVTYDIQNPNIAVQNTSSTLSERFTNMRPKNSNNRNKVTPSKLNLRLGQKADRYQSKKKLAVNDLRKVLSAKRRASIQTEDEGGNTDSHAEGDLFASEVINEDKVNISKIEEPQNERDYLDWLEDSVHEEDNKLKVVVTRLKNLAKSDMDPECWYIVADYDILLNHLNFLNVLCDSDDGCTVVVPQQIMSELRELARDAARAGAGAAPHSAERRARRAVAFIAVQLDTGHVLIGDGTCGEGDTRCDYLINCCSSLWEQNYHVILLSNDDGLAEYKNCVNIPIFNMKDMKRFLSEAVVEYQPEQFKPKNQIKNPQADRLKPPPSIKSTKPIKITVANDFIKTTDQNVNLVDDTEGTQFNVDSTTVDKCDETATVDNELISHPNDPSVKHTNDAEVQTDTQAVSHASTVKDSEAVSYASPIKDSEAVSHASTIKDSEAVSHASPVKDNAFLKQCGSINGNKTVNERVQEAYKIIMPSQPTRREIKLNRNISVKTSLCKDMPVETKNFKWRRRRRMSATTTNDSKLPSVTTTVDESNRNSEDIQKNDKTAASNEQQLAHHYKEGSVSSGSSSFIANRKLINESVIIDETSTSGVISNSASNVDSESESGNKTTCEFHLNEVVPQKYVMFKIIDEKMEDSLRFMNDEWISRFIQIMEEVLTLILTHDQQFLHEVVYKLYGGGPWTLREAADCIRNKFSYHCNIVDAANKLNNILKNISDSSGRITANLQPLEFMEMYSFGVYLVKAIKSVINNCEDLQVAEQSLSKLLCDIMNPNFDSSHNDTFGDTHLQETSVNFSSMQSPKSKDKPVEQTTPIREIVNRTTKKTRKPTATERRELASPKTNDKPVEQTMLTLEVLTPKKTSTPSATESRKLVTPKTNGKPVQTQPTLEILASKQTSLPSSTESRKLVSPKMNDKSVEQKKPTLEILASKKISTPNSTESRKLVSPKINDKPVEQIKPTLEILPSKKTSTPSATESRKLVSPKTNDKPVEQTMPTLAVLSPKQISTSRSSESRNKYKLRSNYKNFAQDDNDKEANKNKNDVTFIRKHNVQDSFLSSLNLVKKCQEITSVSLTTTCNSREPNETTSSQDLVKSIFNHNVNTNQTSEHDTNNTEPKIIRKFKVCPEFEKKLKGKRELLDMEELDYSAPFDDVENYVSEEYSPKTVSPGKSTGTEIFKTGDNLYFKYDDKFCIDSPLSMNNNLNSVLGTIVGTVKNSLLNVRIFCEEMIEELSEPAKITLKKKLELYENAEKAQVLLGKLSKTLYNIQHRETYEPHKNIQSLLKNAGINYSDLDDNQLKLYRDVIETCVEKVQRLEASVALIVNVIKKKPIE